MVECNIELQLLGANAQCIIDGFDLKRGQRKGREVIAVATFARDIAVFPDDRPGAIEPGFAVGKMLDANQIVGEDADLQTFAAPALKNERMRGGVD